jgi:hypothetical protein
LKKEAVENLPPFYAWAPPVTSSITFGAESVGDAELTSWISMVAPPPDVGATGKTI